MMLSLEGKQVYFSLKTHQNETQDMQLATCVFVSDKFVVLSYEQANFANVWIPIDNFAFIMEAM